jgi:transcriptional regulator with GAF, ATPase, and Fis domain
MAAHEGTRLISGLEPQELAVQSYRLELVRGAEVGQSWELGERGARVGKGPDNDVVIADATVSRYHFVIEPRPEGFLVKDVGSTNGTFLEGSRVVEAYIKPGQEIRAGEVVLRLKPIHEGVSISPSGSSTFGALLGTSAPMRKIFALLDRVAATDATILLCGETGTGKGAVSRAIHDRSARASKPFVTIDCGAISRSLIESELFGHEKGSFTGATHLRRGALEMCAGGTLFIDELDDLPLEVQPKLLRALDEREICRVGSSKPIKLDLRVVAATKKDLRIEVAEGRFREDLYFRLSIVTVPLPPLRDRIEDLPLLADRFLEGTGSAWDRLPRSFRERLLSYHFPGNVRELRNLIERASYLDGFDAVDPTSFPTEQRGGVADSTEFKLSADYMKPFKEAKEALVERFEREYLRRLLGRAGGKIARAAREAQIDRKYLYMLLSKHSMTPSEE